jgi:hypothetical protein
MTELQERAQPPVGATGGWLLPETLMENLQLIADGIVAVAGFEVAAIRIRRGDELELVLDTELPEQVGSRIPLQLMLDDLAVAEDWGLLRFVPHERGSTAGEGGWIVPDVVSGSPAWPPGPSPPPSRARPWPSRWRWPTRSSRSCATPRLS